MKDKMHHKTKMEHHKEKMKYHKEKMMHSDEKQDKKLVKEMVKKKALK